MFRRLFTRGILISAIAVGALLLTAQHPALAESSPVQTFSTARFTLHFGRDRSLENREQIRNIAEHSLSILEKTFQELTRVFGTTPTSRVILRFLTPNDFRLQTGAPAWTSAMYYRGEITIPVAENTHFDFEELRRTIRHEYAHAIIAELSRHKCPAWIDEGVAQILEGPANPLLGPALREWIKENEAMPLGWLKDGFTTLDQNIVPAAYAQSLFATRSLLNSNGFEAIVNYLKKLAHGEKDSLAFEQAFNRSQRDFETALTDRIRRWANTDQKDP